MFDFKTKTSDRLETDGRFTAGHSAAIVKAYRKVMQHIRAADDERDLRAWPGLNFKKFGRPERRTVSVALE
jgi:toxin HigB-1